MNPDIKPLVITPLPILDESLMGLILRTSEANGYSSPNDILRYAGLSEKEIISIRPPLDKIAPLIGKKSTELAEIYPDPKSTNKTKKWVISNHAIAALYVNIKSACICPECILEKGFTENIWEIKLLGVCTKHQRELVDTCPACNKKLRWQRKGLLTCACGNDLSSVRGKDVNDASLKSIGELIRWKLHNHQHNEQNIIKAGYPISHLRKMSLSTLLGIIERLQTKRKRKTNFPQPYGDGSKLNVLKVASDMFSNWPNGFYDLLENLSPENRHIASRNLQAQYRYIYNSFFKSGLPETEMKFIRKAFVTFANERLGEDVYIDARLAKHAETSRRFVGIYGLAEHLKVELPTIRNYVKKGLLKPEIRESMGRTRKVFDLLHIPFKAKEGKYLKQREAAKFLHLSPRMLIALKKDEIYKIQRLGWGIDGFNELDLIEFRERFINKAPNEFDTISDEQIRLGCLFRRKHSLEVSVKVLNEILVDSLVPVGRTGCDIADIVLNKSDLVNYIQHLNVPELEKTKTYLINKYLA